MPDPPRPDPPAHSVRLAVHGIINANPRWANIFWVRNGSNQTPDNADMSWLAQAFYDFYVQEFTPYLANVVTIQACNLLYYGPAGFQEGADHIENTLGGQSGQVCAASCSACISWKVNQRYKGGHPRTYLPPPIVTEMQDSSTWTATYADGVRVAANQFNANVNGAGQGALTDLHLGTVSFVLDNAWRNPPVFRDFTPTAALVDPRIDTQRRRLGPDR